LSHRLADEHQLIAPTLVMLASRNCDVFGNDGGHAHERIILLAGLHQRAGLACPLCNVRVTKQPLHHRIVDGSVAVESAQLGEVNDWANSGEGEPAATVPAVTIRAAADDRAAMARGAAEVSEWAAVDYHGRETHCDSCSAASDITDACGAEHVDQGIGRG